MRASWPDDLGRIARQRRLDLTWSQEELAARADVTRQWLTRFETGTGDPALSKVLRVLRELRLDVDVAPEGQQTRKRIAPAPAFAAPDEDASGISTAHAPSDEAGARTEPAEPAPTDASGGQLAAALQRLVASQHQMRALGRPDAVTREPGGARGGGRR